MPQDPGDGPHAQNDDPGAGYGWFVVWVLSLISMVSFVGRQFLSLLFQPLRHDLHLTDTQVSLLAGLAFVLFYAVIGLFAGRIADRCNRKAVIIGGGVAWSMAAAASALARGFWGLFAGRVGIGIGEATISPAAVSIIADSVASDRLPSAMGIYSAAQYLGAGLALVVGGWILRLLSALPQRTAGWLDYPWEWSFVGVGVLGLLVLVPLLFVREPARGRRADAGVSEPGFAELAAFARANRRVLASLGLGMGFSLIVSYGAVIWVPTFVVRVHGWTAADVGTVYGLIVAVSGSLGVLIGARVVERLTARGWRDAGLRLPMITTLLSVPPAVAGALMPSAAGALACFGIACLLYSMPVATSLAALQALAPAQLRGQVFAAYGFAVNLAAVGLGPTLVAFCTDHLFRDAMALGRSLALVAAVLTPLASLCFRAGLRDRGAP